MRYWLKYQLGLNADASHSSDETEDGDDVNDARSDR